MNSNDKTYTDKLNLMGNNLLSLLSVLSDDSDLSSISFSILFISSQKFQPQTNGSYFSKYNASLISKAIVFGL